MLVPLAALPGLRGAGVPAAGAVGAAAAAAAAASCFGSGVMIGPGVGFAEPFLVPPRWSVAANSCASGLSLRLDRLFDTGRDLLRQLAVLRGCRSVALVRQHRRALHGRLGQT